MVAHIFNSEGRGTCTSVRLKPPSLHSILKNSHGYIEKPCLKQSKTKKQKRHTIKSEAIKNETDTHKPNIIGKLQNYRHRIISCFLKTMYNCVTLIFMCDHKNKLKGYFSK